MRALRLTLTLLAVGAAVGAVIAGASGSALGALLLGIAAGWAGCAAVLAWDLGWGLALTPLAGAGVSAYLLRQHVAVLEGVVSVCSVNATFDCDAVNTSGWSEMFGVPVALWGLAFYLAVAASAALWRIGRAGYGGMPRILLLLAVSSNLYSAYLAWISHYRIHSWCLFCIGMYGLNLLLLAGAVAAVRRERRKADEAALPLPALLRGAGGDRSTATLAVAGLAALFVGALAWQGMKQAVVVGAGGGEELAIGVFTPAGEVEIDGSEPVFGKAAAPYLVVEFADFQCPYCARASAEIKELVRAWPDVQLRFKDYPISSRCNPEVEHEGHRTACDASFAAECAHAQGRFWEFADLLMKNQAYQSPEDLRFMAGQIGLDMDAFEACIASDAPARAVVRDVSAAARVEVHGTPTFFVKGLYGDAFVLVRGKPEAIFRLIESHRKGRAMPQPGPLPPEGE